MRYVVMQFLTWGAIAGAVGSALLLAALDSPLEAQLATLPRAELFARPDEATRAGSPPAAAAQLPPNANRSLANPPAPQTQR